MMPGLSVTASRIRDSARPAIASRTGSEDMPSLNETWARPDRATLNKMSANIGPRIPSAPNGDRVGEDQDAEHGDADQPGDPVAGGVDDRVIVHVAAEGREPEPALPEEDQRHHAPQ